MDNMNILKDTPRMGSLDAVVYNDNYHAGSIDESMLSADDRAKVNSYVNSLTLTDARQVMSFGAGAQKNISDFSVTVLKKVKTRDLGDVGTALKELTVALNSTTEPEKRGVMGLFQKAKRSIESIKADYAKAETNVQVIEKDLEKHQVTLMQDISMFDQMYQLNFQYYKDLTLYIIAGKKILDTAKGAELEKYREKAETTQLQEDIQAYNDYIAMCNRFEKKLHDLEITRTITIQTAPQIRMLQNIDEEMLEKIQSSIINAIPLWRHQIVIVLGLEHSARAIAAQNAVSETINNLLSGNAEKLRMAASETAKESERAVVDIETLKKCNRELITAINDVVKIHEQGSKKRQDAEKELVKIEDELKSALLKAAAK